MVCAHLFNDFSEVGEQTVRVTVWPIDNIVSRKKISDNCFIKNAKYEKKVFEVKTMIFKTSVKYFA